MSHAEEITFHFADVQTVKMRMTSAQQRGGGDWPSERQRVWQMERKRK